MSNYLTTSILFGFIIMCQAASLLTPKQHAKLKGDMFCARSRTDPDLLKNMCIEAARREGFTGYDESLFENLSCKENEDGKVLLDPGTGRDWVTVQDALLECKYKFTTNDIITRTFGRGLHKHGVFQYTWDFDKNAYIVESLRDDLLKNLIPN